MRPTPTKPAWSDWLPLALGLVFAVVILELVRTRVIVRLEEAALGTETQFSFGGPSNVTIVCQDARNSKECIASYEAAKRPPAVLWLGNSQLPAINRLKLGDSTAPALLHDALRGRGYYLVTYAQPNANLFEHALVFGAVSAKYDTHLLILPVFLDDIREQGIRSQVRSLLDEPAARVEVQRSPLWPFLAPLMVRGATEEAPSGSPKNLHVRFENTLNAILGSWWPLWESRPQLRGIVGISLYPVRNKLLGINAQTKRKVDPGVYREKMAVLDSLLTHAAARGIKVLLYVPPYRLDIQGPYVEADYQMLKEDLKDTAKKHGAQYANLEDLVPGSEWGTVVDIIFGFEDYDFMHFTGEGHKRHAEALDVILREMGF